jgi:hypothetical protein
MHGVVAMAGSTSTARLVAIALAAFLLAAGAALWWDLGRRR